MQTVDIAQFPNLEYISHLSLDVLKAIDATSQVAQGLERQDLEGEMERLNVLETPFYDKLGKVTASAYEHEYNVVTSRQDKIGYAVYRDGGVPRTVELELARRRILPSLIGQRISYTELTIATTKAGVKSIEQTARDEKIVAVMEETEYLLMYGDRRFGTKDLNSPKNLQFDGMENIVKRGAPQNILDLGGKPLSLAALWAAENKVYQAQGLAKPNVVFISPIDKINLQSSFYQLARTNGAERAQGVLGATAQTYISAYGETELVTSRFLGDWHKFSDQGAGNTGGEYARPAAPSTVAVLGLTSIGEDDGLDTGKTLQWAVKAFSFNGESSAKYTGTVTTTDGHSKARIAVTNVDPNTLGFIVYRKDSESGKFKFLKKVPYYGAGQDAVLEDDGHETFTSAYGDFRYKKVPGTGVVFGVDLMTTNLAQWIPLEQVPLPQTLNRDFAIRHVSSLFSRAPEFNFAILNVGQETSLA